jgi:hypothetical protein
MRVEFLAERIDFRHPRLLEGCGKLFQGEFDAVPQVFDGDVVGTQRRLQAVLDRQQFGGKFLGCVLVRLGDVFLRAAAQIFCLGLGAQPGVVVLSRFQFSSAQKLFEAGEDLDLAFLGACSRLLRFEGRGWSILHAFVLP